VRGYAGRGRWPDLGELASVLVLAVISVWGVWFAVQSLLTLWWPLNVGYLVAGLIVAVVSAAVARAVLRR
jgi:divalent metal cation (Fe/Co/Zn/Cd) transporter